MTSNCGFLAFNCPNEVTFFFNFESLRKKTKGNYICRTRFYEENVHLVLETNAPNWDTMQIIIKVLKDLKHFKIHLQ